MSEARSRWQWNHTSHLLSLIANTIPREEGSEAYLPRDFNPYCEPRGITEDVIEITPTEGVKLLGRMYAGLGS